VFRINNCVGEDNQWAFMQLLAYAYVMSLMSLVVELMHIFYLPQCVTCDKARVCVLFTCFTCVASLSLTSIDFIKETHFMANCTFSYFSFILAIWPWLCISLLLFVSYYMIFFILSYTALNSQSMLC